MSKTILIVEDNALCMKLFSDLLESHGFNILCSVDGMDTMQLAREHHPDLILMDIKLPKVSGLERTEALKADDDLKDIPIIAVTGFAMVGDKGKIMASGCDAYLTKPINVPLFLEEVTRFVRMGPFRLTKSLMTGDASIDAEHDELGALLNEFLDFLALGDDAGCAEKIEAITKAITSHFDHEEKTMEQLGYQDMEEHKSEHQDVIKKYNALIKSAQDKGYGSRFASEITSILVHDMILADTHFKEFLAKSISSPKQQGA